MTYFKKISSGAKWEDIVGYSRAIKAGNLIEIAGTTAIGEDGEVVGINDPAAQTRRIIEIAKDVLQQLGVGLENVIRTRIFTTDISKWEEIGSAHWEYFSTIKPVNTMVEVSKLVSNDMAVEIEFTAWVEE
ncbi:MAG: RidA family protein [Bacteroidetes bacterium]|nr:RidA family protein [Bacteroidota bacterium]